LFLVLVIYLLPLPLIPVPSSHHSVRCTPAFQLVFLPHCTDGPQLPLSYCFALDHPFMNQILSLLPSTVLTWFLLYLAVPPVRLPSITNRLFPTTLTTTFPSAPPLATTPLTETFQRPHSSLYKLHTENGGFVLDSWTLRMVPDRLSGNLCKKLPGCW